MNTLWFLFVLILAAIAVSAFAYTSECRYCHGLVTGRSRLCKLCQPIHEKIESSYRQLEKRQ
jgi:hypothetical protein